MSLCLWQDWRVAQCKVAAAANAEEAIDEAPRIERRSLQQEEAKDEVFVCLLFSLSFSPFLVFWPFLCRSLYS